jgi:hypothetical protein
MIKLRFINLLILLLILTLPCFGCSRQRNCTFIAQSTSAIPNGFGVNIDFTDPRPGEMKMLSEAGFRWVRIDLKWEATEKERGSFDFSAYDRLLAALEDDKLHALFILDYGNPLYDKGAPPRTEPTRQAFARWTVAAAKHFAGRGALWEVYNEPNHSLFWPPQPSAQEYVALALAVGRAFRENVPDEQLIGPATSEIDFNFLESCFKAGLLQYWSAVSIHPYRRSDPETAAQDYCRLREMIKTYSPVGTRSGSDRVSPAVSRQVPIISSEWGYSAVWPGLNAEKQGQLLARSWLTNVANGVSLSIWYDWRDDGLDANDPEHHFGTVGNAYHEGRDPVYDPKPAYLAAKTLSAFFDGYRFEQRMDLGSEQDYLLVFRKDDQVRFAAWTTASGVHEVVLPLKPGSYKATQHTGQEGTSIKADQKGLAMTLTAAPIYIRP